MFSPDDTIVAIATPARSRRPRRRANQRAAGVRRRRRACSSAKRRSQPRHATFTRVRGESDRRSRDAAVDEVVATWFPAPHSYTGEHVVEISAHGSPVVLQAVVRSAHRGRRAAGATGRVHAPRVPERQARSGSGGGRRRSDRRRRRRCRRASPSISSKAR